ncbi:hypothetical protein B0H17DRAFT_1150817 [Mycena rosella]|uniref:F-box domain-containing protein n=1 Tax=Mycena rosella TaxID=1033263 RepID=A0AAD7FMB7_MYCRO|nr:hypothetical protein B0H17DRAFT_1150817 [Mycena rosella]
MMRLTRLQTRMLAAQLPPELKLEILGNLDQSALLAVSRSSKQFRHLATPLLHRDITIDVKCLTQLWLVWTQPENVGLRTGVKSLTIKDNGQQLAHQKQGCEIFVFNAFQIITAIQANVEELNLLLGIADSNELAVISLLSFSFVPPHTCDTAILHFANNHPNLEILRIRFPFLPTHDGVGTIGTVALNLPQLQVFEGTLVFLKVSDSCGNGGYHKHQTLQILDVVVEDDVAFFVLATISHSSLHLKSLRITQISSHRRSTFNEHLFFYCLKRMRHLKSLVLDTLEHRVLFEIPDNIQGMGTYSDTIGHTNEGLPSLWSDTDENIFVGILTRSKSSLELLQIIYQDWAEETAIYRYEAGKIFE